MNELLPYEEQLAGKLANIPLPAEDRGWDAMRKMLENDDDDVIVPPANKGCRGWGLVLLLTLLVAGTTAIVYKVSRPVATTNNKDSVNAPQKPAFVTKDSAAHTPSAVKDGKAQFADTAVANRVVNDTTTGTNNPNETAKTLNAKTARITIGKSPVAANGTINKKAPGINQYKISNPPAIFEKSDTHKKAVTGTKSIKVNGSAPQTGETALHKTVDTPTQSSLPATINPKTDEQTTRNTTQHKNFDSTTHQAPVTKQPSLRKDSSAQKTSKDKDDDTDNKIWFGAGVALQQLIPVDGQKAVPYNAFGRKGSLGDYIPSAYFRVYQKRQFLQVEFRYGAPQYAKDIEYSKKVISHDSTTGVSISSNNHVKKTYYNQLPVSFHYSVLPNLSIGAGFIWNRFQSAVVQQETEQTNSQSNTDSILQSKLINVKSDSSFAKSYFQFMLETQYTWKRFSLGARYSWGITPYITYTSPLTGQTQKERNASLQIFLRYELWQSKKK